MEEYSYFISNTLVQDRYIFLLNYYLFLSLLQPSVRIFWKKKSIQTKKIFLNNNDNNNIYIFPPKVIVTKKIKTKTLYLVKNNLGSVWYVCLKTENYYLKIFIKIRVGEKVY